MKIIVPVMHEQVGLECSKEREVDTQREIQAYLDKCTVRNMYIHLDLAKIRPLQ